MFKDLHNSRYDIKRFVLGKIRELLTTPDNEDQIYHWTQASAVFKEVVIPWNTEKTRNFYKLARDILEESESYHIVGIDWFTEDIKDIKKWMREYKEKYFLRKYHPDKLKTNIKQRLEHIKGNFADW